MNVVFLLKRDMIEIVEEEKGTPVRLVSRCVKDLRRSNMM